ncbi:MAG TPA: PKD domain-containing protein, partial [Chitinophagaceae bacterium]|nr:PKD domain-containing protein [Chitinophagaceae bacterium]
MNKCLLLLGFTMALALPALAHHIIGGEMSYQYLGSDGSGGQRYAVTLKLYRGCEPVDTQHADFDPLITYTIYNNDNNQLFNEPITVVLAGRTTISAKKYDPCIINPPQACYEMATYHSNITLPDNRNGYTITYQRCCRTNLLTNANTAYNIGATYTTQIPGGLSGIPLVSGPYFDHEEAVLICSGSRFSYNYSAIVPSGDSVSYSFCEAYAGGSPFNTAPDTSSPGPYAPLEYVYPYSPVFPMGSQVSINPHTGVISGIAPAEGTYVIAVCVTEYQGGIPVGTDRKDFHISVTNCQREAMASIPPYFKSCRGFTINFTNSSTTNKTNLWQFGDGDTSTDYNPVHTYRDTGIYLVKLNVDPGASCGDSATTQVVVYPVLDAAFSKIGACLAIPIQFRDKSVDSLGTIDSWHWDFGDRSNYGDTSNLQNPTYQYKDAGTYPVALTVGNSKGCLQSDTLMVQTYVAPPLTASADTDLCIKDSLQIFAMSAVPGSYSWGPPYNILAPGTQDPTIFPRQDTAYLVTFTDTQGCSISDSVDITVKSRLLVSAGNDTTICLGDNLHLHASSDGPYGFSWVDAMGNPVGTGRDVVISPRASDTYTVLASLESCSGSSSVHVKVVPPPQVVLTPDTSICYGTSVPLMASGGSSYSWSPGTGLSTTSAPNPTASPVSTTAYTVTVTDTLGCPRSEQKTVMVGVYPPVIAFAGNDTIISSGISFQLHATGADNYFWSPPDGLSSTTVPDPVVSGTNNIEYYLKASTLAGCLGYDSIQVRYVDGPQIYVPNAFTPNGDGKNDIFRPIPVGISRMDFFRVYNR